MVSRVQQEEPYGCGIACLAMVIGKTYQDVRSWFKNEKFDRGISTWELDMYLCEHGYAVARKYPLTQNVVTNQPRDVWPVEPWADVHIWQVRTLSNTSHFIVLLRDGTVLDPFDGNRKSFGDYQMIENITAIYKVE